MRRMMDMTAGRSTPKQMRKSTQLTKRKRNLRVTGYDLFELPQDQQPEAFEGGSGPLGWKHSTPLQSQTKRTNEEQNRERCLRLLEEARVSVQKGFTIAKAAAGKGEKIADSLMELQVNMTEQIRGFATLVAEMNVEEFKDTSHLESMIRYWQADVQTNLQAVIDHFEAIAKVRKRKSQEGACSPQMRGSSMLALIGRFFHEFHPPDGMADASMAVTLACSSRIAQQQQQKLMAS